MTFSTLTFFVFVGVVFAAYWVTGRARARNLVLLGASYLFYGAARAREGLRLLLWGLFQKIALADNLATIVDAGYSGQARGPLLAIATASFAFQIYWDFCGYSNMAVGTARLFGIELRRNFAYPYFSRTVRELWRRWHITLSTWFRDYVYIPLGGNRRGRSRQALALMLTFGLSGLWHGAAWGFVVWGLWNGLLVLPSILRRPTRDAPRTSCGPERLAPLDLLRMVRTFVLMCIGWVFFRAPTLGDALRILRTMVVDALDPSAYAELAAYDELLRGFGALLAIVVLVEWLSRRHEHPLTLPRWPRPARWLVYAALGWTSLYLMPEIPHRFIYFQF